MARKYNMEKLAPNPITDLFGEERNKENADAGEKNGYIYVPVDKLKDYSNHRFQRIKNWEEFKESIKAQGVLNPIIIRPAEEGTYEILAGHNRTMAARELGIDEIPAIIKDVDDIAASVIVGVSNNQREEVTDIEWGWAYRDTYEVMKRQAGRPKGNCSHRGNNYADEENGGHDEHNYAGGGNYSHGGNNLLEDENKGKSTLEILADKYGIGKNTIHRKIRLTYLIDPLAELVISGKLKQAVAVDLSYLTEKEQDHVYGNIFTIKAKVTPQIAKKLKELSKEKREKKGEELTIDEVFEIMTEGKGIEAIKDKTFKASVPAELFPEGIKSNKEKEAYVIKAMEYIVENKIDLKQGGQ